MLTLARWADVVAHLGSSQREVVTFPGERLRFAHPHEDAEVAFGAHRLVSGRGSTWIGLATKLGPAAQLRERSALVENLELPVGGIAVVAEHAVLRQTLPLPVSPAALDHAIRSLATLALQVRHAARLEDADLDVPYAYLFH